MINKRFTIAASEINTKTDNILEVEIIKTVTSPTGNTDIRYYYPNEIQIINNCGSGVEWLLLSSLGEYAEYTASPSSFTFIRLPEGFNLQDGFNSLGRCHTFIIKGYETFATSDLIVEFINYRPSALK